MKALKSILAILLLGGFVGASAAPAAADGVLFRVRLDQSGYCHMKFPAIQEGALASNLRVLKDAGTGDIIDFYGPCSYDPAGDQEAWVQRHQRYTKEIQNQ